MGGFKISVKAIYELVEKKRTYRMPRGTSKKSGLPEKAKTTAKRVLVRMALIKSIIK